MLETNVLNSGKLTLSTSLFALVIGINAYPVDPLISAVADADKVNSFLVHSLGVGPANIQNLRDGQATRKAILDGFDGLINNPNIRYNDAIVIYYAGYGSRVLKPDDQHWVNWQSCDEYIEMICPVDIGTPLSPNPILGIPDRTIAAKLDELSRHKGNNIIVIFDCCSSAGANRIDTSGSNLRPRYLTNPPGLHSKCDYDIWFDEGQHLGPALGSFAQGRGSHTFLAACGRDESAYEDTDAVRGLFTSALVNSLERFGHNDLTYVALMQHLIAKYPILKLQTPHYYGEHVNRRLFSTSNVLVDHTMFSGHRGKFERQVEDGSTQRKTKIELLAGRVHGIQQHFLVEIYRTNLLNDPLNEPLGVLLVSGVQNFTSALAFSEARFTVPRQFYAKETGSSIPGLVTVYCPDRRSSVEPSLHSLAKESRYTSLQDAGIKFVDNMDDAVVELYFEKGRVIFHRTDPHIVKHVGSKLPFDAEETDLKLMWNVLIALGRFRRFLNTTGQAFRKEVQIELRKLKRLWSWDEMYPVGSNIIDSEVSDDIDGTVDVEVDDSDYGVTLRNHTENPESDLYPYLVYFDACNLSIKDWFLAPEHPMNGKLPDSPLCKSKELGIGYGDGGAIPWSFNLAEDMNVEMGYLKLYVASEPIDIRSILQESPFDQDGWRERSALEVDLSLELWGTQTIQIIQRRKPPYIQVQEL